MFSIGLQFSLGELRSVGRPHPGRRRRCRWRSRWPSATGTGLALGWELLEALFIGGAVAVCVDRRAGQGGRRVDAAHHRARAHGARRVDRPGPADGGAGRRPLGARQPRRGVDRRALLSAGAVALGFVALVVVGGLPRPAAAAGLHRRAAFARAVRDRRRGHRHRHRLRGRGARREHRARRIRRRAGAGRLGPDRQRARRDRPAARAVQHVLLRLDRHPAPAGGHPGRLAGRAGPAADHHLRQGAADRRSRAARRPAAVDGAASRRADRPERRVQLRARLGRPGARRGDARTRSRWRWAPSSSRSSPPGRSSRLAARLGARLDRALPRRRPARRRAGPPACGGMRSSWATGASAGRWPGSSSPAASAGWRSTGTTRWRARRAPPARRSSTATPARRRSSTRRASREAHAMVIMRCPMRLPPARRSSTRARRNPRIEIVARAHSEAEEADLRRLGAARVVARRAGARQRADPPRPAPLRRQRPGGRRHPGGTPPTAWGGRARSHRISYIPGALPSPERSDPARRSDSCAVAGTPNGPPTRTALR